MCLDREGLPTPIGAVHLEIDFGCEELPRERTCCDELTAHQTDFDRATETDIKELLGGRYQFGIAKPPVYHMM